MVGRVGTTSGALLFACGAVGAPQTTPFGDVWIDPLVNLVVYVGWVPPGTVVQSPVPVPTTILPGLPLTFQGVQVLGATPLVLSNPVTLLVR